ncbi:MAG: GtrA family protein [Methylocystaceae bacterium]
MLRNKPWHVQFISFGLVGIANVAIDLGGFNLLIAVFRVYTGPFVWVLSIVSATAAMVNSYMLNRRFTFGINDDHQLVHINRFAITSMVGIFINSLVVAIVSFLTPHLQISPHFILSFGKILGMGSEGLWNFIIYRYWVFA